MLLAPAVISRIVVDESENLLEVTVPDDQLTNAIGRKGQNVKLAAKLLGWKIDIFSESRYNEANAVGRGLEQVASVAEISVEQLVAAGYNTLDSLRDASDEELADRLALSAPRIAELRAAVNFLSPVVEGAKQEGTEESAEEAGSRRMGAGHEPSRMCVICRRRFAKSQLLRHVLSSSGGEGNA